MVALESRLVESFQAKYKFVHSQFKAKIHVKVCALPKYLYKIVHSQFHQGPDGRLHSLQLPTLPGLVQAATHNMVTLSSFQQNVKRIYLSRDGSKEDNSSNWQQNPARGHFSAAAVG